ncbi:MAG: hypothetical protein LBF37_01605 [Rickettsiales bacterium]|jgi:hypothetical protein|nr:hypothetical protein [Rickettsiales bacterium]
MANIKKRLGTAVNKMIDKTQKVARNTTACTMMAGAALLTTGALMTSCEKGDDEVLASAPITITDADIELNKDLDNKYSDSKYTNININVKNSKNVKTAIYLAMNLIRYGHTENKNVSLIYYNR